MTDMELSPLGQAALEYIKLGFGIFPLGARSKKPATAHGVNDWTDNPEDTRAYWLEHPDANIGIACGAPSGGLLVLDFDVKDTHSGLTTLKEWETVHGALPETAEAITGGGGRHLLFRTDRTGIRPSTNAELGVDVRCDGSYIVAPPSVHPSGELYEWWAAPDDVGVATADGNVYDFLDHVQRNGGRDETGPQADYFVLPDRIRKGERNDVLFKLACSLRGKGRSDEEIMNNVVGANFTRCTQPLDSADVMRIVRSACRYDRGRDGGKLSDREIGAPGSSTPASDGGSEEDDAPTFIGKRGGIDTTKLGNWIIGHYHARIIDGAPAVWTGSRWDFGARAIKRATVAACGSAKIRDKNEVLSLVMDKAPRVSSSRAFDGRYYVQFSNCTWDVIAWSAVEPTPTMLIIGTLPVALDLDAPRNLADSFLWSISAGDKIVMQRLCEIIGACMCSSRIVSQAPMLIGRARGGAGKAANGKSTYINWIAAILGSENVTSLSIDDFGNRFNKGMVAGKLANLGDDIPDGFLKGDQLSTFKKMVTGDAIYADVKGSDGFEFRPTALQVFSMNAIPRMSDTTDGIMRRLSFTPFRAEFRPGIEGYDPDMEHKLAADDVLARGALCGLLALPGLIERGRFVEIPEMQTELDAVMVDNNSVARWVEDECIEPADLDRQTVAAVYKSYSDWADDAGEKFVRNRSEFSKSLIDYIGLTRVTSEMLVTTKMKINGSVVRAYKLVNSAKVNAKG